MIPRGWLPIALLLLARPALPQAPAPLAREMDEVARVGSVMVDGDLCQRIQTPRSREWMLKKHPTDPWVSNDNFDVDPVAFNAVKKTLMRLARLSSVRCDVNLWMFIPSDPSRIQILIRNVHELSQFWTWGDLMQPTPPEMKRVLETRTRLSVSKRSGTVSALAPVFNSLGDVVGVIEAVGQEERKYDPRENVK